MLREALILNEQSRDDETRLAELLATIRIGCAQLYEKRLDSQVSTDLFNLSFDQAALQFNRLGKLLQPWNPQWLQFIEDTEKRIYKQQNAIGDTDMTGDDLVWLAKKYEELKAESKANVTDESGRPTDD